MGVPRGAHDFGAIAACAVDKRTRASLSPPSIWRAERARGAKAMKIKNSLRSLRARHRDNRLVRRKGRVYVINKTQKRYKARQG